MARIRIECRMPEQPPPPASMPFVRVRRMPSLKDCRVLVVADDGTEKELEGVTRIAWSVGENDVAEARIEVVGVAIDAEGLV